jgi:hypothetical protein
VEGDPGAAGGGLLAAELFPRAVVEEMELGLDVGALVFLHGEAAEAVEHALEAIEVGFEVRELAEEEVSGGGHERDSLGADWRAEGLTWFDDSSGGGAGEYFLRASD